MYQELIKVKGFQVAPSELEGHLLEHEGVLDCAVIRVLRYECIFPSNDNSLIGNHQRRTRTSPGAYRPKEARCDRSVHPFIHG
jgi:hypothetical protein